MATIQDIAKVTGLSVTTVSRYLNGKPYVSERAASAIADAVQQLEYYPAAAARSLSSKRAGNVTVLLRSVAHPFYASLLAGIGTYAQKEGAELLVQQTDATHWEASKTVSLVAARGTDGIILASEIEIDERGKRLLESYPVVACDQAMEHLNVSHCFIDHEQGTLDALEYLHLHGARRVLCFYGPDRLFSSDRFRTRAFEQFARDHGDCEIEIVYSGEDTVEAGFERLRDFLPLPQGQTGVFAASDQFAAGMLLAARERRIPVPERLAIVGFDDQPIASVLGLTTVRQPVTKMGEMEMRVLAELIDRRRRGKPLRHRRYHIRHRIVRRTTS